jgi:hypothetical protein
MIEQGFEVIQHRCARCGTELVCPKCQVDSADTAEAAADRPRPKERSAAAFGSHGRGYGRPSGGADGGGVNVPALVTTPSVQPQIPGAGTAGGRPTTDVFLEPHLALWGAKTVTWGKKCLGLSYAAVYEEDPAYIEWLINRGSHASVDMLDLMTYVIRRRQVEQSPQTPQ